MASGNIESVYPLSSTQEGMLFHAIDEAGSDAYVQQIALTINGDLNERRLQDAWKVIVSRHGALRTFFTWERRDRPLQVVREHVTLPWQVEDWQALNHEVQARQLDDYLQADRALGFDLSKAPLCRLALIRMSRDRHVLVWSNHHLISDGWSTRLMLTQLFSAYEALVHGKDLAPPAPRPFKEYIEWLAGFDLRAAEAFWRRAMQGYTTPTLMAAAPRDVARSDYTQLLHRLPETQSAALRSMAQTHQVTLNTLFQAAWAMVLQRHTGEDDVLFGMTVSGRPASLQGVEDMVGLFINTLPLRLKVDDAKAVQSWLKEVQAASLAAREHEHTPLAKIRGWSELAATRALFDTLLVFENYPAEGSLAPAESGIHVGRLRHIEHSEYPLALIVEPDTRIALHLIYDRRRVPDERAAQLLSHVENVLAGMIANPQGRVADVPMLSSDELHRMTVAWNSRAHDYPRDTCIHRVIEQMAARQPDAVAVIHAGQRITYTELNRRANRIAHSLRQRGVQQGDVVGLCVERSADMIAGILGILKAGAAYLPLDPSYPAQRLSFMLNDAGASHVLAQGRWAHLVDETAQVIAIDADEAFAGMPEHDLSHAESSTQRAYVIYTSGSTGQPKGVPVMHRNLVHSTFARFDVYQQPVGCFLLLSTFAFDSSVAGIFWTLCSGGALCLPMQREEQDANAINRLIFEHAVTHTLCLPSLYQVLLEHAPAGALRALQVVIVAGESCPSSLLQWHAQVAPHAALFNEYGPTEGTVWCSVHRVSPAQPQHGPVPIGRPIPNMQLYIVDARHRPVPVGATGELLIGGDGLVEGYLNRPELTAARFIHAPALSAHRLYRSGDLARFRADGEIEFLCRIDQQIKIRGHRIELEEIESALAAHPSVLLAAAVAMADAPALSDDADALAEALAALDAGDAQRLLDEVEFMNSDDAQAPAVAGAQPTPSL